MAMSLVEILPITINTICSNLTNTRRTLQQSQILIICVPQGQVEKALGQIFETFSYFVSIYWYCG